MNKSLFLLMIALALSYRCLADSGVVLREKSERILQDLYKTNSAAQAIGGSAIAVLVFPEVCAGGFLAAIP
jgi:hypothetical protein